MSVKPHGSQELRGAEARPPPGRKRSDRTRSPRLAGPFRDGLASVRGPDWARGDRSVGSMIHAFGVLRGAPAERGRSGSGAGFVDVSGHRMFQITTQQMQHQSQHFLSVIGLCVGRCLGPQTLHERHHEGSDRAGRRQLGVVGGAEANSFRHILRNVPAPLLVDVRQPLPEIVPMADLRQEGVLQGVEIRIIGRIQDEPVQEASAIAPSQDDRRCKSPAYCCDSLSGLLAQSWLQQVIEDQREVCLPWC